MYTVIISRSVCDIQPKDYEFLFDYVRLHQQMKLLSYDGTNTKKFIDDMNDYTRGYEEWKLIIFDGQLDSDRNPAQIDQHWVELFKSFFDPAYWNFSSNSSKCLMQGKPPKEFWYINSIKSGEFFSAEGNDFAKPFFPEGQGEISDLYIPGYHPCWIEVDTRDAATFEHEKFKVCASLLLIASNDFSSNSYIFGDLYRISIRIDRTELIHYISTLQYQVEWLKRSIEKSEDDFFAYKASEIEFMLTEEKNVTVQNQSDSQAQGKVQLVKKYPRSFFSKKNDEERRKTLRKNREWLEELLSYSKDDLHNELTRASQVEKIYTEYLIDEVGRERNLSKMNDCVADLHINQGCNSTRGKIRSDLTKWEQAIEERARLRLDSNESRLSRTVVAIVTTMLIGLFVNTIYGSSFINRISESSNPIKNFFINIWYAAPSFPPGEAIVMWLLKNNSGFHLIIILIIGIIIVYFIQVLLRGWYDWHLKRQYKKFFSKVEKDSAKRNESLYVIMTAMVNYRRFWSVLQVQKKLEYNLDSQRENISVHSAIAAKAEEEYLQLRHLLGEEIQLIDVSKEVEHSLPRIDFTREPDEKEFLWLLNGNTLPQCELNRSGEKVMSVFRFIKELNMNRTGLLFKPGTQQQSELQPQNNTDETAGK